MNIELGRNSVEGADNRNRDKECATLVRMLLHAGESARLLGLDLSAYMIGQSVLMLLDEVNVKNANNERPEANS